MKNQNTQLTRRILRRVFLACVFLGISSSAAAQGISLSLRTVEGEPIVDAVLELLPSSNNFNSFNNFANTETSNQAEIDQRDKEFVPSVTTIAAGGSISFPNSDDILHHVYSFSTAKTFDTPLYGSDANSDYREVFEEAGVVEIGCNIHDWMLAYIYVGESSLMAISDDDGQARLPDVPAGEYTVRIWHARLDAADNRLQQTVIIEEGPVVELDVRAELVRDRRVRRAPSANRKRYR